MNDNVKKMLVLPAALIIQSCLGGIYAWSVFAVAIHDSHGISMSAAQLVFGIASAAIPLWTIFASRLCLRIGGRAVTALGGALFGAGFLLASFSGEGTALLYAGIGLLAGAGIGHSYVTPISASIAWFPTQKGLVSGVAVAGYGCGAILLAQIAQHLLASGADVYGVFRIVGPIYGAVIILCSFFLFPAPGGRKAEVNTACSLAGILKTREFRLLFSGMFCGTFAGLLVIGNLKPIGLSAGLGPAAATLAVSFLAAGNATGRVTWGFISDRIQSRAIPISLFCICCTVLLLLLPLSPVAFSLVSFLIGFSYGGCFVLYAAASAQVFGASVVSSIYPYIFAAMTASGLAGPWAGGAIFDLSGSYRWALVISALTAGAGSSYLLRADNRKCISCEAQSRC
ncbi:MAG: MFS transporter [Candidatus Wallbacteria bacterium]|nr:MFS transporter [Candidatus Wallbacteria bacterium]